MKRIRLQFVVLMMSFSLFQLNAKELFSVDQDQAIGKMVLQSSSDLCSVARGTLAYLERGHQYDPEIIQVGRVSAYGVDLALVKRTLAFICQVEREDAVAKRASRLADAGFIRRHFKMIRWLPKKSQSKLYSDNKPLLENIPDNKILLTKYYIKLAQGSDKQSNEYPYALYQLPFDEKELSLAEANDKKTELTRYQFTKQQVLTGVLNRKNLASPLVWLSREDLEDTLMQGTVKVNFNGKTQFYNVHRNNNIGYKRNLKKREQQRYWYFKQTPAILGYGKDANYKIPIKPLVTVAGDLKYFGLGKLMLLTVNGQSRLTILADTGGAFENNQYQLDYLGGYFKNWDDYINSYRTFPDYFEARILVLKEG